MKKLFPFALVAALAASVPTGAYAADANAQQSAGAHFERGVALYSEADYKAALTEFNRAYELAPNPLVLYNIGQAQFQLRNYAGALTTFERYLTEAGANPPHAQEVQQSIETLKTRVGRVDVDANVPSEITIDDEPQGKTPLVKLLVSVGRHKVVAKHAGSPPQERTIDIAAGDALPVSFKFESAAAGPRDLSPPPPAAKDDSPPYATIAWITTGALAAGAVVTGVVATTSASSLADERALAGGATRDRLDSLSTRTSTFALVTDILAASAVVAGGVALYFTLSRPKATTAQSSTTVGVSPLGLSLRMTY